MTPTVVQRFWSKVERRGPDECWLWTARLSGSGNYGYFTPRHGKSVRAHRFAYQLLFGPIPDGALVLHSCDTPACVNPGHLHLGTHADNHAEREARGRHPHASIPVRLSAEAAVEIRRLYQAGDLRQRDIAARFGVGQTTVSRVVRGVSYPFAGLPS